MMDKIAAFGEKLWRCTSILSGFVLTAYMVLVIVNVVMRKLGGKPIFGIIELVCYASLAACCLALAQTEWKNGNVTMTLILDSVGPKMRSVFQIVSYAACFAGFVYVSVQCLLNAANKYKTGGGTTDIHIPFFIITYVLAMGFILLDLCVLMRLILKIGEARAIFKGKG